MRTDDDDEVQTILRNARRWTTATLGDGERARQQAFCDCDRLMNRQDALLRALASANLDDADRLLIGKELTAVADAMKNVAATIMEGVSRRRAEHRRAQARRRRPRR